MNNAEVYYIQTNNHLHAEPSRIHAGDARRRRRLARLVTSSAAAAAILDRRRRRGSAAYSCDMIIVEDTRVEMRFNLVTYLLAWLRWKIHCFFSLSNWWITGTRVHWCATVWIGLLVTWRPDSVRMDVRTGGPDRTATKRPGTTHGQVMRRWRSPVAYLGFHKRGGNISLTSSANIEGSGAIHVFIFVYCDQNWFLAEGAWSYCPS